MNKEWFDQTVLLKFEGITIEAPIGYDSILRKMYGDYMKLPPESERYNHITQKIDFGPYEDWFTISLIFLAFFS